MREAEVRKDVEIEEQNQQFEVYGESQNDLLGSCDEWDIDVSCPLEVVRQEVGDLVIPTWLSQSDQDFDRRHEEQKVLVEERQWVRVRVKAQMDVQGQQEGKVKVECDNDPQDLKVGHLQKGLLVLAVIEDIHQRVNHSYLPQ